MATMEFSALCVSLALGGLVFVYIALRRVNEWVYEYGLGNKRSKLPPGDMGWPLIGNMMSFLAAFKSGDPDSFIAGFVKRFSTTGIYKAFMFGSPTILVTTSETCKQVLMDETGFMPGWPSSTCELIGYKSFIAIPYEEHKWLRKITAAPVNGPEALSTYLKFIEDAVIQNLDKWSTMGEIEFLTHVRKLTFRIITYIFLSSEGDPIMKALEREYTALNYGVRAMAINLPGFAYHKALKARKKLVAILHSVLNKRRETRSLRTEASKGKKDMMDALLEVEDDDGRKLSNEQIIDTLIMYLNAGHESSGHVTMWAIAFLEENPEVFQRAKAEQEEVVRRRPPSQKGLTYKEYRSMEYLSIVIDETLRVSNISSVVFRRATKDIYVNGYIIPKDWKVQVWLRNIHMDSQLYKDPKKFDPSRWENYTPKAGTFIPFGAGNRLCPGNDLAKLEIAVFLHYFLLGYQLKRSNPGCPVMFLPHHRPIDNCLAKVIKTSSDAFKA